MEHIKSFDSFLSESRIVEGITYNDSFDADMLVIGEALNEEPENTDPKDLENIAKEALEKALPIPLTGKIKTDAPKLITYIVEEFKREGVELDEAKATLASATYKNEIDIPLFNAKDICFNTYLDYTELAENGSEFVLTGSFYVETDGQMDITITDISNRGNVIAAIAELKQYFETHRIKL